MTKRKVVYTCAECGNSLPKWQGQCPECGAWNTLSETIIAEVPAAVKAKRVGSYAPAEGVNQPARIHRLMDINLADLPRLSTGMEEMDRVLGGGIVPGGVVLLGGDPGIGKSTILLQTLCYLSQSMKTLYVTGEESLQQVAMRARRLHLAADHLQLLTECDVDRICEVATQETPQVIVIDSIQTMYLAELPSAPGGVSQVRESAAHLTRFAKQNQIAFFLVGHVTKEGGLSGPRVLEHIVDTVIFVEGRTDSRFRVMRAFKNRFGALNELGVFAMTELGLKEVKNPSAIFLSRMEEPAPGSVVMVIWEGSRPLLIEIQALVDESHLAVPRRVTLGLEQNRLAMLLAVLHRHGRVHIGQHDVFVNVVGGVRVTETSADLALLLAIVSSLRGQPLPQDLVAFGEVGLAGEIRPVASGPERLREAAKHGFKRAIVPKANVPRGGIEGIEIMAVKRLVEALAAVYGHHGEEQRDFSRKSTNETASLDTDPSDDQYHSDHETLPDE